VVRTKRLIDSLHHPSLRSKP